MGKLTQQDLPEDRRRRHDRAGRRHARGEGFPRASRPTARWTSFISAIGVLLAASLPDAIRDQLVSIQHQLFDLGGELCIPGHAAIDDADVERLEQWLDAHNAGLPALKGFLSRRRQPRRVATLARTIVRRAEREAVTLSHRRGAPTGRSATSTGFPTCCSCSRACSLRAARPGEVLWNHERRR